MMFIRQFFVLILVLLPLKLFSLTSEAGAIFLIIYPGARPNGMGAAFTAISDDALATYYNDGGLGFQELTDIGLMHANWLPGLYPGMYYEILTWVHPLRRGVLGGHIIYLTTGETYGVDETGQQIGQWTTWDAAIKISYAQKVNQRVSFGLGWKYIYSFLAPAEIVWRILKRKGGGTGTSWAFDFGSLYKLNKFTNIGVALQNIGANITYIEGGVSDPLPWMLRLGLSLQPIRTEINDLIISTELTKVVVGFVNEIKSALSETDPTERNKQLRTLWDDTWKGIGLEYRLSIIFLRLGHFWDTAGAREGITFGGGVRLKALKFDIGVDQALYDFPTENYRFSLHYSF